MHCVYLSIGSSDRKLVRPFQLEVASIDDATMCQRHASASYIMTSEPGEPPVSIWAGASFDRYSNSVLIIVYKMTHFSGFSGMRKGKK